VKDKLAKFEPALRLSEIAPVAYEEFDRDGTKKKSKTVGYVVEFKQTLSGFPILSTTVRLRVVGRQFAACLVRLFDELAAQPQALDSSDYLTAKQAFAGSIGAIRRATKSNAKTLYVLSGESVYWVSGERTDPVTIGQPYSATLVYRFLVADNECEQAPCSRSAWWVIVNARDGRLEKVTQD